MTHRFSLEYLIEAYNKSGMKEKFFSNYFNTLAGTDQLKKMIMDGKSEGEIKASWSSDLEAYKVKREKYLIYGQ